MNELTLFNNPDFGEIRTLETNDGKVLFCGADVAKALGYKNYRDALSKHCKGIVKCDTLTNGGKQKLSFIPEPDIYRLTFSSKLPNAEKFTDWVTEEILPSIRKAGAYAAKSAQQKPTSPDKAKKLEIQEMNARARLADRYLKAAKMVETRSETYGYILTVKATEILAGEQIIPLPKIEQKTYSAGEVGKMLGVSANKIGRLANANGLKTKEYGDWYKDKAKNSDTEVDTFRYNQRGIDKLKEILKS